VSQADYDLFYSDHSKYADNKTSTGGGGNPMDDLRLRETAEYIAFFLTNRNARILDIGCATGGLIKWLNQLGFPQTAGIDPSDACVRLTKETTSKDAWKGSLSAIPEGIGTYDLVVLSHVVEHVQDVSSVVTTLKSLLNEDGLAYVEVPNAMKYKDCLIAPFQDFNTEHINHFSVQALKNLFRSGWEIPHTGEKLLALGAGHFYPASYIVARNKTEGFESPVAMDVHLRPSIEQYIDLSKQMIGRIDLKIQYLLEMFDKLIVYGTGQLAMKLLRDTCLNQANIEFFVDSNPLNQGKTLHGKPIHAPSKILESASPILVASLVNAESIQADIRGMDVSNKIFSLNN
jgi:SAM-dependent methyltransferase